MPERLEARTWALILGAAAAIRVGHFVWFSDHPLVTHPQIDAAFYDRWARDVLAGVDLGTRVLWAAPLYPAFVTVLYAAFGPSVQAVAVAQHLLGVLATGLFTALMLRLVPARAALVAGLIWAVYPLNAYSESFLLTTALLVQLNILAAWAVARSAEAPGWRRSAGAGLAWGLLSIGSDSYLFLGLGLLPLWWGRGRDLAAFGAGIGLLVAPVTARNFALTGELIPISAHGGEAVYIANNPKTDGLYNPMYHGFQKLSGHETQKRRAEELAGRPLGYGEANRYWMRRALEFAAGDPVRYLRLLGVKALLAVHRTELPNNEDYRFLKTESPVLRWNPLHFGVLFPLALVGLVAGWRARRRLAVLYLMSAVNLVPVLVVFAASRYRMPLLPFVVAFAALGLVEGAEQLWRRRSWRRSAVFGAVLALGLYVCNRPWPRLQTNRGWSLQQMGRIALAEGRAVEAARDFERALELQPRDAGTLFLLGKAYAAAGRPEEAFRCFQGIERDYPDKVRLWREMAELLLRLGRCDAARPVLEKLLAARPGDAEASRALQRCSGAAGS
jgi:4-amino-4-deoxy-L-arabinose transferase-like glycosyltransferase